MTLKFFFDNYNLLEEKILRISANSEKVIIDLMMDIDIHYIGNGLRSSFEYKPSHRFIFKDDKGDFCVENPKIIGYSYENNILKIGLENMSIELKSSTILLEQNYKIDK